MEDKMCDCNNCPTIKKIVPHYKKYVAPASKRAWEKTKYDFHAGYSKACEDMLKLAAEELKFRK